jgi:diketogulonate reductase-like aldo/keto reductase
MAIFKVYQTPPATTQSVVSYALKTGYRHIDSARVYYNEGPCARAMSSSGLPRSELFFTSKVYSNSLSYAETVAQINSTIKATGLSYIDLMLIHAPYGGSAGRKGAWKALVEAVEAGKVRSIGVSNYGVHHLDELEQHIKELEAERGPGRGGVLSVGQWELQPWLSHPDIVAWCRKRGVVVQAFSPLTRGKRLKDPLLKPLMKKHNKTAAQILMRWSLQMGFVPLPKSENPSRIEENADVYDLELSEEDMEVLDTGRYENSAWDPTVIPLDH